MSSPKPFLRLLRVLFLRKISLKLASVISILVLALLLILGITLTHLTEKVLKNRVQTNYKEIAQRAAHEVAFFVERPVELLEVAAKFIGRTNAKPWDQETVLVELSLAYPMFEEIHGLLPNGKMIASSNPGIREEKNHPQDFKNSFLGKVHFSEIFIGQDHLPKISVAVPVRHTGKIASVLAARVNVRGIWDIVDAIRIGKSSRALLITEKGLIIAHPDKKVVLRNAHYDTHSHFTKVTSGKTGSEEYVADGKRYLASFAAIPAPIPLFLVIEQEAAEAYALLDQMRHLIWWVVFLSLLLSVSVSFWLANRLVRPVKALESWSKKVALGDFDFRIPPDSSDEIGRLFIMFGKMSERLKIAREKEHLAALGTAATTLSHKLKNAIVSLKTFSQLLPQKKENPQFMSRFERDFAFTVEHLEKIFKNLSQVTTSRAIHKEAVDLYDVMLPIREIYAETVIRLDVQFRFDITPGVAAVLADREQMNDLFINLIQNSIQAMPHGGTLFIKAEIKNPFVNVQVRDTGIGIPSANLDQIFRPFFSTKHSGMGLGLAICKKIIEDHNGTISVRSEEGKGTTFSLSLPLYPHKVPLAGPARSPSSGVVKVHSS